MLLVEIVPTDIRLFFVVEFHAAESGLFQQLQLLPRFFLQLHFELAVFSKNLQQFRLGAEEEFAVRGCYGLVFEEYPVADSVVSHDLSESKTVPRHELSDLVEIPPSVARASH